MANTAMSQICTGFGNTVVLEGKDRVKKISGKLSATAAPGYICQVDGAGTITPTAGASGSANRLVLGVLEYKPRTSTTFGEKDIDSSYTDYTRYNVELIVGPRDGTLMVAARNVDPGAAYYYGKRMMASSGGKFKITTTTASKTTLAIVTEYGIANGDTVGRYYLV